MSKLTRLELRELQQLAISITKAQTAIDDNSDSVDDFIFGQIDIDTKEPAVIDAARKAFHILKDEVSNASMLVELLLEHFKESNP